jgi:hypothetical protein
MNLDLKILLHKYTACTFLQYPICQYCHFSRYHVNINGSQTKYTIWLNVVSICSGTSYYVIIYVPQYVRYAYSICSVAFTSKYSDKPIHVYWRFVCLLWLSILLNIIAKMYPFVHIFNDFTSSHTVDAILSLLCILYYRLVSWFISSY